MPEWFSLVQIYLGFAIPVLLGLLVSLNVVVWARMRINYVFIFGSCIPVLLARAYSFVALDVRTVVDSRDYAEVQHCRWYLNNLMTPF